MTAPRDPSCGSREPLGRCDHVAVAPLEPTARKAFLAAGAATTAFALFTVWWSVDGGLHLDDSMLRFTGWLLRGWLDVVISASWPLGEPQFGLAAVGLIAMLMVARQRYRLAALVVGGFLVLSAVEVAILVALAEIRHVSLSVDALSHLYPSGHTARVPFLGTAVAAMAGRPARLWILIATAGLTIVVALDRTDSKIQTGSAVIGGLLMGISASLWLAALFTAWKAAEARPRRGHQPASPVHID